MYACIYILDIRVLVKRTPPLVSVARLLFTASMATDLSVINPPEWRLEDFFKTTKIS